MQHKEATHSALVTSVFPQLTWLSNGILIVSFSALTALCSQFSMPLPFSPVPVTGQTFAVLLSGLLLGGRRAAVSQILYLLAGLAGFPVFSPFGPPGLARILGPAGGYLLSFPLAAFVVGFLADRGWARSSWKIAVSLFFGEVTIYLLSLAWLAQVLHRSWVSVLPLGLYPFLIGDVFKTALIMGVVHIGWFLAEKRKP